MVGSKYRILTICTPPSRGGAHGSKTMDIAHMLVMIAKSTTETWYQLVFDASGDGVVLFRSKIHVVLAKISFMVLTHATSLYQHHTLAQHRW